MKYNFNISVKKTNRLKTMSLKVKNQEVVLSVPRFVSDSEIESIIEKKINWIKNKLAKEKTNRFLIQHQPLPHFNHESNLRTENLFYHRAHSFS